MQIKKSLFVMAVSFVSALGWSGTYTWKGGEEGF